MRASTSKFFREWIVTPASPRSNENFRHTALNPSFCLISLSRVSTVNCVTFTRFLCTRAHSRSGSYRSYLMFVWPRTTGFRCLSSPRDQVVVVVVAVLPRDTWQHFVSRDYEKFSDSLCFQVLWLFAVDKRVSLRPLAISLLSAEISFRGHLAHETITYPPEFLWLNSRDVIVPFASPTFCPASLLSAATGIFDDILAMPANLTFRATCQD